nr:MAG TPA: hypothetical protein [Caudoviricetes sp.]
MLCDIRFKGHSLTSFPFLDSIVLHYVFVCNT